MPVLAKNNARPEVALDDTAVGPASDVRVDSLT